MYLYIYIEIGLLLIFQICLIGACEQDKKLMFFDSVQSLSKRTSIREIE